LEAIKGTYDVTAINFGTYPYIKDDYALLRTAISFGNGYGPKLIKKKNKRLNEISRSHSPANIRQMPYCLESIIPMRDRYI